MRRSLAVMLLMLAVPMMGSDCSVAARVGGPPSVPPEGSDPPPDQGGGGGVIIVTSGASSESSPRAEVEGMHIDRALVAAALAASVWTSPRFVHVVEGSRIVNPSAMPNGESIRSEVPNAAAMPSGDEKASAVAAPVPEPTGSILFACGVGLAAEIVRLRRARG